MLTGHERLLSLRLRRVNLKLSAKDSDRLAGSLDDIIEEQCRGKASNKLSAALLIQQGLRPAIVLSGGKARLASHAERIDGVIDQISIELAQFPIQFRSQKVSVSSRDDQHIAAARPVPAADSADQSWASFHSHRLQNFGVQV
jgi:hypothetical protein